MAHTPNDGAALPAGRRLGPYEVESLLGAGGMGEVYRARDTRLGRTVAIKVLSRHRAASPEFQQRFEREALTISQLSHANVCALYDVGLNDETPYLVMEYLQGETLANRLTRGALPLPQVCRVGAEIAEALAAAHRQGIVHRDLKPGNVMLSRSGVKLLDFGLAKAFDTSPSDGRESVLATRTDLTETGTVLGTVPYMAPEQLEGGDTDSRTDLFALGAVVYEMAAGVKAFPGGSQAAIVSAILRDEPAAIARYQPLCPSSLDRAVRTCLAKSPESRWQSAGDVAHVLRAIAEGLGDPATGASSALSTAPPRASRERLAWGAFAVAAAAALALVAAAVLLKPKPPATEIFTSSILPPDGEEFQFAGAPPTLSPDGRRIAFSTGPPGVLGHLWVRAFDEATAIQLPGTEDSYAPFWSPDGRSLGFFSSDGKLKRVEIAGGAPTTLCDAPRGVGGTWSRDGVILFVPLLGGPICRVAATGGAPTPVTEIAAGAEVVHAWPHFLPDGRHFLYSVEGASLPEDGVFEGSLESKAGIQLVQSLGNVSFAPREPGSIQGNLLYVKDRVLMAQALDVANGRLTGEAVPVAEPVDFIPPGATSVFSVSQNGVLAYHASAESAPSRLVWRDRSGAVVDSIGRAGAYFHPRISHDGTRVAYVAADPHTSKTDVWIHDFARRASTRLTFDSSFNLCPIWSPDDRWIYFNSTRHGAPGLYRRATSGEGDDELVLAGDRSRYPMDASPANGLLAFETWDASGEPSGLDLETWAPGEGSAKTILGTRFDEVTPQWSPDGRWLAYSSNESGRPEVYVRSLGGTGTKQQVSTTSGAFPRWSRDGREIIFIGPDATLQTAAIGAGADLTVGIPRALFSAHMVPNDIGYAYDLSPDGKRILLNEPSGDKRLASITIVQNWTKKLGQ